MLPVPAPQQRPLPLFGDAARDLYDPTTHAVRRLIERMLLDDALVRRRFRLERLKLIEGREHLRLYARQRGEEWLVGLVDIASERDRASVYRDLALYLAALGFTTANTRLVVFGAKTELDAPKQRLPRLFAETTPRSCERDDGAEGEDAL